MTNILLAGQSEFVFGLDVAASGTRSMLRPEQTSLTCMGYLVAKFSGPRDVFMDFCAVPKAEAQECLLLSEHRRFVE